MLAAEEGTSATGRREAEKKEEQVGTFRAREGDEEERGERSLPPPHLEKCPNARVLVGTKSAGPDMVYRPWLSRSLACHRLYLLDFTSYLWEG